MQYVPVGLLIGLILLSELTLLYGAWTVVPEISNNLAAPVSAFPGKTNTESLGLLIYTHYLLAFQCAGLILFVAMVGAIVLTHRVRPGVRKQSVADQQRRRPEDVLEIKKMTPGTGL
jgi:NADH-quinone oxidoreductase subunit J